MANSHFQERKFVIFESWQIQYDVISHIELFFILKREWIYKVVVFRGHDGFYQLQVDKYVLTTVGGKVKLTFQALALPWSMSVEPHPKQRFVASHGSSDTFVNIQLIKSIVRTVNKCKLILALIVKYPSKSWAHPFPGMEIFWLKKKRQSWPHILSFHQEVCHAAVYFITLTIKPFSGRVVYFKISQATILFKTIWKYHFNLIIRLPCR